MNRISSQQRKLVYLIIIVLLLAPIVYFGAPGNGKDENSGGKLAQLRSKYDLGETSLGNVDPASATMNLVLLGLRGIASNMLWSQAVEQKSQKDWAGLRATVDSIVLLQPHFKQVWEFQGWNLAYNVSAEWDGVADRYEWVKEGAKFMMRGSDRNYKYPELYWESGRILGQKIGRADEKLFFRRYFLDDPNREGGGPDPEVNPDGKDNYLAAKDWFEKANEVELQPGVSQSRLARVLFRSYPVRSQIDYANTFQEEGKFDEIERIREAWEVASTELREDWGSERFMTPAGAIVLEANDEILEAIIHEEGDQVSLEQKHEWVNRRQNMSNYRYWRLLCRVESEAETIEAHRNLFLGKRAFIDRQDTYEAERLLTQGMTTMEKILGEWPELKQEDNFREECLKSVVIWRGCKQAQGEEIPADFPLKSLWDSYPGEAQEYSDLFRSLYGG
ncbi:hypothetical protein [Rubinisphaera italica]|uniref:IRE (Iron responsive element) n=1 Tax=Rubinisphaera italica TaxID=2527969 RepID=A0A5C5XJR0_9PLAN|nr:hypothetical protein [Rubinisphaera italica]TWT62621.1 hypothetical protein Pan54_33640 [Rubinisphaera italica]